MSPLLYVLYHLLAPSVPQGLVPLLVALGVGLLGGYLLGSAASRRARRQDEALRSALATERQLSHDERRHAEAELRQLREALQRAEDRALSAEGRLHDLERLAQERGEAQREAEARAQRAEDEVRAHEAALRRQAAELVSRRTVPPAPALRPAVAGTGGAGEAGEAGQVMGEAPVVAPKGLRGVRALCAVADEASLGQLKTLLGRWGLKVRGARDGYQGLELLREAQAGGAPMQLVILDGELPGLDGAALGRLLRDEPELGAVPRVLLAAGEGAAEEGVFAATLRKPAGAAELAACLQSLLGKKG